MVLLLLGFLLALGLYYLGLFVVLRDRTFLHYSGFVVGMALYFLTAHLFELGAALPVGASWNAVLPVAACTLADVCYPLFVRRLLGPARIGRGLERTLLVHAGLKALGPVVAMLAGWAAWGAWTAAVSTSLILFANVATVIAWRRGFRPALFLLLGSVVLCASSLGFMTAFVGLPPTPYAMEMVQVGIGIQALLLAFAVAWRIREVQTDRARALRAHAEVEASNVSLREALVLKSNLLSFAAHDLRSPLTGIRGFSELVQEEAQAPQLVEYGALIEVSADRLLRLIDDLLVTAELDATLALDAEPTDLGALVEAAVRPFAPLALAKDQRLDVETTPGCLANVDADRFQEVVDNLVSNAVKYSPSGGRIGVSVGGSAGTVHLRVTDSGPGFTRADRGRLFRPFTRLSARPTGGESSTGLGLAIVKRIVDLHEGRIHVDSRPGVGTRFTVALPAVADSARLGAEAEGASVYSA